MRAVGVLCLVAVAGCQLAPKNPAGPDVIAANGSVPLVLQRHTIPSTTASVRPDQVCRGGPEGSICWTPGNRPPTGPQPGQGLLTFEFTGTVSYLPDPLGNGPLALGQAVSGSYTFDPTATDQDPSSIVVGLYESVTAFNVSIPVANYSASASAGTRRGHIEILDNEDGVRDRYVVDMSAPEQNVSGPGVAGMTLDRLAIVLRDRTTLAVSSDALPLTPPLLSDFAFGHELFIGFTGPSGTIELGATLTSLTTQ